MAPAATSQAQPAPAPLKPRTPRTLQKRKLTVAEAADQWEKATRAMAKQKALQDEAKPILLAHFERTNTSTYQERIAREPTGGNLILDQVKIKAFLGAQLRKFQKRQATGWTLKLLR